MIKEQTTKIESLDRLLRALLAKEGEGKEKLDLKPVKGGVAKELISWSGLINEQECVRWPRYRE